MYETVSTSKPYPINIISSNSESNVYPGRVIIKQKIRTKEEYEQIYKYGDFQLLTSEDMQWIDENVSETIEIVDEKTENRIIDLYFDGNTNKYKSSLII